MGDAVHCEEKTLMDENRRDTFKESCRGKLVAILISYSGQGGVEKVMNLVSRGFLEHGVRVDIIAPKMTGEHTASIPPGVKFIRFKTRHTYTSLLPLAGYLRKEKPDALLAVKHRAIVTAVLASRVSRFKGRLVGSIHTNISASLQHSSLMKKMAYRWVMKFIYKRTDMITGVSQGVVGDILHLTGISPEKAAVVYNPVATSEIQRLGKRPVEHPWFCDGGPPVILGIGRLTKQKDFHTLIRSFSDVARTYPCRLIILGDGEDLHSLGNLAGSLGIGDLVDFPGFQKNPYCFLARSRLFVLSSRWEGFGVVLVEAMALGIPVVSTDCPSGPREILKDGLYGPLVPTESPSSLTQAIISVLKAPPKRELLQSASEIYAIDRISRRYLDILLAGSEVSPHG